MYYRLSTAAAVKLEMTAPEFQRAVRVVNNTPTTGIEIIDGTSVRVRWAEGIMPSQRGLYGVRLVGRGHVLVGLCCVDETLDQAEVMVFPRATSSAERAVALLTCEEVLSTFEKDSAWLLLFVYKTSEFATIAFGAWLHDHLQRNLDALASWGLGKQMSPATRASLLSISKM